MRSWADTHALPTTSTAPSWEERIYHDAGATTSQGLRRHELLQLIRKAGRTPVERDTLYRPVERSEATFAVLV